MSEEVSLEPVTRTDVLAPIVGNIWLIEVEVGEHVEAGQTLMVLESMKMEIPITATSTGIVAAIPVELAQIVQEGDVVAQLSVTGGATSA